MRHGTWTACIAGMLPVSFLWVGILLGVEMTKDGIGYMIGLSSIIAIMVLVISLVVKIPKVIFGDLAVIASAFTSAAAGAYATDDLRAFTLGIVATGALIWVAMKEYTEHLNMNFHLTLCIKFLCVAGATSVSFFAFTATIQNTTPDIIIPLLTASTVPMIVVLIAILLISYFNQDLNQE